jgi:transposase InsO family protein
MSHRNAPLTPQGRLRLVLRCRHRPIAHIAAEAGVSRQCLGKWVARYREHGEAGLCDQSSAPLSRPTQTPPAVVDLIATLRKKKWSARRIARELADQHVSISVATVTRWLHRLGIGRLDHLDVDGEPLRKPGTITAHWPGHMIHIDIKKVGRIPDGGGWRVHGVDSDQARAAARATAKAKVRGARPGYVYLHSAVDGFSRVAYTEALPDETATTAIGFLFRARAWFRAHGVTRFTRIVTDNGSCYRAKAFTRAVHSFASRHQRTRPYTPRHNGKVERYQRILANELLYAHPWTSNDERSAALSRWNIHYNYHRPHSAAGDQPPASRLRTGVTNVMSNYS